MDEPNKPISIVPFRSDSTPRAQLEQRNFELKHNLHDQKIRLHTWDSAIQQFDMCAEKTFIAWFSLGMVISLLSFLGVLSCFWILLVGMGSVVSLVFYQLVRFDMDKARIMILKEEAKQYKEHLEVLKQLEALTPPLT